MDNYEYITYAIYLFIGLILINVINMLNTTNINITNNHQLIPIPHFIKKSNNLDGNEIYNVPLNIYHTWNTRNVPFKMKENINYILNQNPEFDYYFYDDDECREYIKDNFNEEVLEAFDSLIPGAYKADLWRCCIMYKKGGVYMDIKLKPLIKLKKLIEQNNFYFVKDTPSMAGCDYKIGIYNAFLISYPNNIIFKICIQEIVNNCKNKFYGLNSLAVTGPCLLGNIFKEHYKEEYDSFIELYLKKDGCIYNKANIQITDIYDDYRNEQQKVGSLHYSFLWNQKNIFNLIKDIKQIKKDLKKELL